MDIEHATEIVLSLKRNGHEASLRERYSGRFMFGSHTAAVVAPNLLLVGWAAGTIPMDSYDVERLRSDSMGYDVVVY